ncbi:MAG: formylglycine-generating enzyme family protein, partial [Nannocystaceae bacterium]
MRFVYVPKGTFEMGSERFADTQPIHEVTLSGFWLGETPVTNVEYEQYLKANPKTEKPKFWGDPKFSDPRQPVVGVSWEDATSFCQWLQQVAGVDATLPSEAQWEYAARGPDNRPYPWGKQPPTPKLACYKAIGVEAPPVVGSYLAGRGPFNALDQSGTVWEWCRDVWDEDAYKN